MALLNTNTPTDQQDTWCTCNDRGICLGCAIERLVKEHLGTDGLAYLLAHVIEAGEKNNPDGSGAFKCYESEELRMENYIGVKLIKAEPMKLGEYNLFKGWEIPADEDPGREGYKVVYPDGYVSWSPKDIFEKAYLQVVPNPSLKSGVSISQQMVDDFIKETHVDTIGEKTTLVRVVLVNGFEIVEASACVDAANYDESIGADICLDKIKDKIWGSLGFLLQTGVGGVKK